MKQYRRSILLVPFINLFYWSAIYLYTPTLSTFAKANGASSRMIGLIIGSFGLAQMVCRLPFGLLSDRVRRRKPFVCAGMALAGMGALIAALCPSSWGLLLARTVTGIGASAWVNFTVLFPAYYAEEQTDQAVSRLNAYCSFSATMTMLLGGWFVELWGQVITSLVAAGCGLTAFLLSLGLADHRPAPSHPLRLADVKYVLSDRDLWRFSLLALTFQLVWHGTVNCFTPILAQRFGVTSSQLGTMTAAGNFGHLVASAGIGICVLPRLKAKTVFGVGFSLMAAIVAATAFSTAYWMLLVLQFLSGVVGYSVFLCALTHCVKEMPDAYRGIAVGMTQAIYGAGMFIGPSGLGQLLEILDLELAYLVVGGLCLMMAGLGWHWSRGKKSEKMK